MSTYKGWKDMGRYGTVGLEFVLSMGVGYYLGRLADQRWFGGHGYGTAAGSLIGVYAAFRVLWLTAKRLERETPGDDRVDQNDQNGSNGGGDT